MPSGPALINDNALRATSARNNAAVGRDHAADREVHDR